MDVVNLWECQIGKQYEYVNTIEEVLELIDCGKISTEVEIKTKYTPGQTISGRLDEIADEQNVEVTYVDAEHIVAYSDNPFLDAYIYPKFFEQYKEQLVPAFQKQILNSKYSACITSIFFSEELFEKLLEKTIKLNFIDIVLTSEQIKKLKENFIEAYLYHDGGIEKISDSHVIAENTKKDLKTKTMLPINVDLSDREINNFLYLNEGTTIHFNKKLGKLDIDSYKKAKNIIEKADGLDKKLKFLLFVDRRSKVENSGLLELETKNVDIILFNDGYEYSLEEYRVEEKKLNSLVANIKYSNMSTFERYIAVYNIVKNYKPYKESDNKEEARDLRYIIDNEYMVCVGYSTLFIELLDKVGIKAIKYQTSVDISYEDGFTQEEKVMELASHRRVMVNLDDDKYNIHGIYLSDPTWDNNVDADYYNHLIMTFDSMQISNLRFISKNEDLIFDVDNFPDFVDKTNVLIERQMRQSYKTKPIDKALDAYNYVYNTIIEIFERIDDSNGQRRLAKYAEVPIEERNENFFVSFLTDAGHYIVERTNNKVPTETIMQAISTVKCDCNGEQLEEQYQERNEKCFPYENGGYKPVEESKVKR